MISLHHCQNLMCSASFRNIELVMGGVKVKTVFVVFLLRSTSCYRATSNRIQAKRATRAVFRLDASSRDHKILAQYVHLNA